MSKIYLLGIGFKPFSAQEEEILKGVKKIYLFPSQLEIFQAYPIYPQVKEKLIVLKEIKDLYEKAKTWEKEEIALLATGDPLLYGLGETLLKKFPKDKLFIYPDLSSFQVLCARVKISPSQVKIYSLHGRKLEKEHFLSEVKRNPYLFVFTDPQNNPSYLAQILYSEGWKDLKLYIGEKLGSPFEKITSGSPREVKEISFTYPNCMLIENPSWGTECIFGLREEEIAHRGGMITKDEIRAIVIHKLCLPRMGILWDIGAGSGSISIECAKLSPYLKVFAIEKDSEQCLLLEENKKKFHLPNLEIIPGEAPEFFSNLPPPDRVFLGGSGGKLREILERLKNYHTLKIIGATFVTLENLYITKEALKGTYEIHLTQVQVNRETPLKGDSYFKALNPIFILQGKRIGC